MPKRRNQAPVEQVAGGWRWVHDPNKANLPYVEPSNQQIQQWKSEIHQLIDNSSENSNLASILTKKVKQFARESGLVVGKWLVFQGQSSDTDIESKWELIKQHVVLGKLGPVAKISQRPHSKVICVYTESFLDEEDVWRVYDHLTQLNISPTSWKADIMTLLNLSAGENNSNRDTYQRSRAHSVPGFKLHWFSPNDRH